MNLKDDIIEMKKEVKELSAHSMAWEMLKDSKKSNKRICIAFTIVIAMLIISLSITVYYLITVLNDTVTVTTTTSKTQEISDIGTMNDNNIVNGDYNGNNKANK